MTAVDICNSALSYVGERDRITSIDPVDGSEESRHCARAYTEAFAELLEMHAWNFAVKKAQLTAVNTGDDDNDDPAWIYRYPLPTDTNEVLAVLPDDAPADYVVGGVPVTRDFHIKLPVDEDELQANGMTLYTNEPDAWVRYVSNDVDLVHCSKLFVAALTWLIASKVAGSIVRGDAGEAIKNRCLAMFGKYLGEARVKDARQRQVYTKLSPEWMRGRTDATETHPFRQP